MRYRLIDKFLLFSIMFVKDISFTLFHTRSVLTIFRHYLIPLDTHTDIVVLVPDLSSTESGGNESTRFSRLPRKLPNPDLNIGVNNNIDRARQR